MTTFPLHVYKSPGNYARLNRTYKIASVSDQEALQAHLDDGWHLTLAEAFDAAGAAAMRNKPRADWRKRRTLEAKAKEQRLKERQERLAAYEARKAQAKQDERDDAKPATREELQAKAMELGIKFDGRTSNKTLLARIDAALKGPV